MVQTIRGLHKIGLALLVMPALVGVPSISSVDYENSQNKQIAENQIETGIVGPRTLKVGEVGQYTAFMRGYDVPKTTEQEEIELKGVWTISGETPELSESVEWPEDPDDNAYTTALKFTKPRVYTLANKYQGGDIEINVE